MTTHHQKTLEHKSINISDSAFEFTKAPHHKIYAELSINQSLEKSGDYQSQNLFVSPSLSGEKLNELSTSEKIVERLPLVSVKTTNRSKKASAAVSVVECSPIIRVKDAPAYLGVSKSTYHNFRDRKSKYVKTDFPPIIELGDNSRGHKRIELDAWLESRKKAVAIKGSQK